jgi:protocatechuate 3,4-dioxygenase beta subunit
MTTGFQHVRGVTSTALLWVLLAVLVVGGVVGWLLLFAAPREVVGPAASVPSDPTSTGPGRAASQPDLAVVVEEPGADPTSDARPSRTSALEGEGVREHLVQGHVRDAETLRPVPLYEVYLAPGVDGDPRRLPETQRPHHVRNLEGRFQLALTSDGTHRLLIRSETHEDLARRVTVPLEEPLDLLLGRGAWISGTVRDDRGRPQPHVTVWLQPRSRSADGALEDARRKSSDERGRFAFYKLTPGAYRLVAGTLTAPLCVREELRVQAAQHLEQLLVVPRVTSLSVRVFADGGRPLPDARVTLLTAGGDTVHTAHSDAEGVARLPSVQQGRYRLQIRAAERAPWEEEIYVSVAQPQLELRRTLSR